VIQTVERDRSLPRLALGLLSLVALAAGCGSDSGGRGVAQVPTTSTETQPSQSQGSPPGSTSRGAAAFAACMRSHGVPKFPDPNSEGRFSPKMGPGTGIDPESAQFRAARRACRKLEPEERAPTPAELAKNREKLLKFASCMRSHGLPKFPDPNSRDGGISIGRASGIDPNSPQFKTAEEACEELLPGALGEPHQQ
jgi:hypothetical protein